MSERPLIILGGAGDLTGRLLLPSLAHLVDAGAVAPPLVAVAAENWDDDAYRAWASERLDRHSEIHGSHGPGEILLAQRLCWHRRSPLLLLLLWLHRHVGSRAQGAILRRCDTHRRTGSLLLRRHHSRPHTWARLGRPDDWPSVLNAGRLLNTTGQAA